MPRKEGNVRRGIMLLRPESKLRRGEMYRLYDGNLVRKVGIYIYIQKNSYIYETKHDEASIRRKNCAS